jgi:hypothetical protein
LASAGSLSGEGRMGLDGSGPSPVNASGHRGEARKTLAAAPRLPRLKG